MSARRISGPSAQRALAKVVGASTFAIWGTGTQRREFLHLDDMAAPCIHVIDLAPEVHRVHTQPMTFRVNAGMSEDISIRELAELLADGVDCPGELQFDRSKPGGAPRKLLSVSRLAEKGWVARIGLLGGLGSTQ